MSEILDYLLEHQDEIKDTLLELVRHESPSHTKALVDACGEALLREMEKHVGCRALVIEKAEVGNQYRFELGEGEEQVLVIAHIDTVWDQGALPIRREDGKLFGPGTFDMKGGVTVSLWAMSALAKLGLTGNRRIVFLVTSDEEVGSKDSRKILEAEARKSACVLVPESSIPPYGDVKTARKGVGQFKIKVTGIPAHAGHDPRKGVNAIEELAMQIIDIRKLNAWDEGVSLNVGVISGGTRANVKAEFAEATIDLRFMTIEQGERVAEQIRNRTPYLPGAKIEVTGGLNRPPMERTDAVVALYEQINAIAKRHGYELAEGLSGGGSDGNFTAGVGTPTIDGLGPVGDGAHAYSEHVVLANLPYRAALIAEMLLECIQGKTGTTSQGVKQS